MKKSILSVVVALSLLASCAISVPKVSRERIKLYKLEGYGDFPYYLTIKPLDKIYDLYFTGGGNESILGDFEKRGDTIILTPRYEYVSSDLRIIDSEVNILSIPIILVERGGKLDDITEYEKYPELAPFFNDGGLYDGFIEIEL